MSLTLRSCDNQVIKKEKEGFTKGKKKEYWKSERDGKDR